MSMPLLLRHEGRGGEDDLPFLCETCDRLPGLGWGEAAGWPRAFRAIEARFAAGSGFRPEHAGVPCDLVFWPQIALGLLRSWFERARGQAEAMGYAFAPSALELCWQNGGAGAHAQLREVVGAAVLFSRPLIGIAALALEGVRVERRGDRLRWCRPVALFARMFADAGAHRLAVADLEACGRSGVLRLVRALSATEGAVWRVALRPPGEERVATALRDALSGLGLVRICRHGLPVPGAELWASGRGRALVRSGPFCRLNVPWCRIDAR